MKRTHARFALLFIVALLAALTLTGTAAAGWTWTTDGWTWDSPMPDGWTWDGAAPGGWTWDVSAG